MNILFVATVYSHLAAFHKPFIKYFQNKGYTVHVAGSNSMGRRDELEQLNVICHDISFERKTISKNNIKAYKELKELLKTNHFELIHVHTPIAAFLTRFAISKIKNQGSLLYTAHGFHFYKGAPLKNWILYYCAEKLAKRWTDGLLVMNEEDYSLAQKIGFKSERNLHFVNGVGVDFEEFNSNIDISKSSIRKELDLQEDAIIISCVAELSSRKNQMYILEKWSEINKNNPDIHLILIGHGPDEKLLKDYVNFKKLKNVNFLGFRKDIPNILSETDIVVLTSSQEGLPRCLMEASVLGKPIIATNVRGSRDIVINEKSGYLVPLNDNSVFIEKILLLANDKEKIKKFSEVSKENSLSYSLEYVIEQMNGIYSKYL